MLAEVVERAVLSFAPHAVLRVAVANGERVTCIGLCRNAMITIADKSFVIDLCAITLGGYNVVLGTQWLTTLGPILWDFGLLAMAFWRHDHHVYWSDVRHETPNLMLHACDGRELMDELTQEFDVFAEPSGLPPARTRDHNIHLPGAVSVAVRPYHYPVAQKDEIEPQCKLMEGQGLICRSMSAFSLVLLVRKQDKSRRFCIDYRTLNDKTVKDKFPIPVVDELLDELRGTQYFTKLDLCLSYQVRMHPLDIEKTTFSSCLLV